MDNDDYFSICFTSLHFTSLHYTARFAAESEKFFTTWFWIFVRRKKLSESELSLSAGAIFYTAEFEYPGISFLIEY
jgi:hypothetical protein